MYEELYSLGVEDYHSEIGASSRFLNLFYRSIGRPSGPALFPDFKESISLLISSLAISLLKSSLFSSEVQRIGNSSKNVFILWILIVLVLPYIFFNNNL